MSQQTGGRPAPPAKPSDPPAEAKGRLKGAPLDGVTADNPAHPKAGSSGKPPRPAD